MDMQTKNFLHLAEIVGSFIIRPKIDNTLKGMGLEETGRAFTQILLLGVDAGIHYIIEKL
jgi:hypothetical protein